jgi:hypothetical protein
MQAPREAGLSDSGNIQTKFNGMAGTGGILTFLAGTYHWDTSIQLFGTKPVLFKGAGAGQTIIKPLNNSVTQPFIDGRSVAGSVQHQIQDMTVDGTGTTMTGGALVYLPRSVNCTMLSQGTSADTWSASSNASTGPAYCVGNTFTGPATFINGFTSALIRNNSYILTDTGNESAAAYCAGPGSNILFMQNQARDQVTNGTASQTGWGKLVDCANQVYNCYMAGNTTTSLSAPSQSGEQILWECNNALFQSNAVSSQAVGGVTQISFPSAPSNAATTIFVLSGTGIGQWGRLASVSGNNLTLDRLWRVNLDATSVCAQVQCGSDFVVYANNLRANGSGGNSACGVATFDSYANGVIDSNTMIGMTFALQLDCQTFNSLNAMGFHTLCQNNLATDCYTGFRSVCSTSYGLIVRNHLANSGGATLVQDWQVGISGAVGNNFIGCVADGCRFQDAPAGIVSSGSGTSTLWLVNSTFSLGSAAFSGSAAVNVNGFVVSLYQSSFVGFQQPYP